MPIPVEDIQPQVIDRFTDRDRGIVLIEPALIEGNVDRSLRRAIQIDQPGIVRKVQQPAERLHLFRHQCLDAPNPRPQTWKPAPLPSACTTERKTLSIDGTK